MNEHSRSLLAAAREGLSPDDAVMARVRARVATAVAPAAPAPRAASSAIIKLGALLVVAGGVAVGVHRTAAAVDAPQVTIAVAHDEPAEPSISTATHEPPARLAVPRARVVETVSLSREVELIDQAMLALRAHDPDTALTVMRTFDRETLGHAQMAEEGAAIDIEARCALDEDVGDRLDAFDRAWPESAQRSRILEACR